MYCSSVNDDRPYCVKNRADVNHTNSGIQAMLVWLTLLFYNFTVFDPSPLTLCIKCSFFYIY